MLSVCYPAQQLDYQVNIDCFVIIKTNIINYSIKGYYSALAFVYRNVLQIELAISI
jgi:hypothetical protein